MTVYGRFRLLKVIAFLLSIQSISLFASERIIDDYRSRGKAITGELDLDDLCFKASRRYWSGHCQ